MFLHCLNHWRLETPAVRKAAPKVEKNEDGASDRTTPQPPPDDSSAYKVGKLKKVDRFCRYYKRICKVVLLCICLMIYYITMHHYINVLYYR